MSLVEKRREEKRRDTETCKMMMRHCAREAAKMVKRVKMEKIKTAAGEILGAATFIGLLSGFCWLCCAASGYHWE